MPEDKSHLVCLGYGYVAQALAATLDRAHWRISGTVRGTVPPVPSRPVTLLPFAEAGTAIAEATHILVSIPPDATGDPTLLRHGSRFGGLTRLKWLGYLSTTGVYGDTGGRPVDETAALVPTAERSRRRIKAEFDWEDRAKQDNLPLHIFRLAGIYGPRRSPFDQIRAGTARRISKPGHAFSRIHVEDIVGALTLSMRQPQSGAIYNLCDDEAAEQVDVIAYACSLLGVEPPPSIDFAEAEPSMSAMQRSFWEDNRRIDNSRIKRELGLTLRYPTYREGLAALANSHVRDRAGSKPQM